MAWLNFRFKNYQDVLPEQHRDFLRICAVQTLLQHSHKVESFAVGKIKIICRHHKGGIYTFKLREVDYEDSLNCNG